MRFIQRSFKVTNQHHIDFLYSPQLQRIMQTLQSCGDHAQICSSTLRTSNCMANVRKLINRTRNQSPYDRKLPTQKPFIVSYVYHNQHSAEKFQNRKFILASSSTRPNLKDHTKQYTNSNPKICALVNMQTIFKLMYACIIRRPVCVCLH